MDNEIIEKLPAAGFPGVFQGKSTAGFGWQFQCLQRRPPQVMIEIAVDPGCAGAFPNAWITFTAYVGGDSVTAAYIGATPVDNLLIGG